MVRFVSSGSSRKGIDKTVNRAGGIAFKMTPEKKLLNLAATCMFGEDKYYGSVEEKIKDTLHEVTKNDAKFPLQLANYVRTELHLRTTPIALLVMAANETECKPFVRGYCPKIIQRADELCETIAAQLKMYEKPIPNSLKKGVADSFAKFTEYSLAKYNRDGDVKLKDVIMLTHVKNPSELIQKILDDSLETPETWEVIISTKGSTKENWEKIIPSMNYMALIRNINNFIKVGIPTSKYLPKIEDKKEVLKSKQLPFRFYSAMNALQAEDPFVKKEVLNALEHALEHSVENLPHMKGRTVIAVDLSNSMNSKISDKSMVTHKQISSLFGAMANRFCDNGVTYGFAEKIAPIELTGKILADAQKIEHTSIGCQTNGHLVINDLLHKNIKCDRIIFFTDEEMWNSNNSNRSENLQNSFNKYKQLCPECKLYMINVNGYGETCINNHDKNVTAINGFSTEILKLIQMEECDQVDLIKINY